MQIASESLTIFSVLLKRKVVRERMIEAVKKCVAGLDIHKKTVMCTILTEKKGGVLKKITREFSTFRDDLNQLAKLLYSFEVELVVMESTERFRAI